MTYQQFLVFLSFINTFLIILKLISSYIAIPYALAEACASTDVLKKRPCYKTCC